MAEEKDLTSRRYTSSQLKTHEMCDSLLEQLEKAISLKEDGLILESDAVLNMLSVKVEKIMTQFNEPKEKTENQNFDESILPGRGKLLAENNKVILKAASDEDYENYMEVSYECSIMRSAFKKKLLKKIYGNYFYLIQPQTFLFLTG